ncbi:MAG: hypothetical protein NT031_05135, partial [Planctomycetota bacterium]|nr:hypothetical protein [Planctomycetota bacterium]
MKRVNVGICNTCQGRAPSEFPIREGQVWIRKDCPQCGPNESLVSTDAVAWKRKQSLHEYIDKEHGPCSMNCDRCNIDHKPNMVFLDVTNRCNMNCPICIATIRDMGFDFN